MIFNYKIKKLAILLLLDSFLCALSFYMAFYLRLGSISLDDYFPIFFHLWPFVVVTQLCSFFIFGLYKSIIRYMNLGAAINYVKTITAATFISWAVATALNFGFIPRSIFIIDWMLLIFTVLGCRFGFRLYIEQRQRLFSFNKPKNLRRVLIYGAGNCGTHLARELAISQPNTRVIGFIDDEISKIGHHVQELKVLGSGDTIVDIAEQYQIDDIIIAMPSVSGQDLRAIIEKVKQTRIIPKIVPPLHEILSGKRALTQLHDLKIEDLLKRSPKSLDYDVIRKFIFGKKVMVTGAGGSIGSELVLQIAANDPEQILLVDNSEFNLYAVHERIKESYPQANAVPILLDCTDRERVSKIFSHYRPNLVFHAAAYKHVPMVEFNPCAGIYNNIGSTLTLAELAVEFDVQKFILISSDKAVRPTNIMGATKKVCELIIQNIDSSPNSRKRSTTDFVAVRFGNVLGSSGSVIPKFREQIACGGPVTVTHPEISRYFMSIPEAAGLVLQAGLMGSSGEIFVLDMGEPVRILDLAREMLRLAGKPDLEIEFIGLRPGEKLHEELLAAGEYTLPTPHPKLRIATPRLAPDARWMVGLLTWLQQGNPSNLRSALQAWVPEYAPGSSFRQFQEL